MSKTIQTPSVKILDQGFKKVLQSDDKIEITEGETVTRMTLREYLVTDRYDKELTASQRLSKLEQMDGGYAVAGPLRRYAFQIGKENKPHAPVLHDEGIEGLLQPVDRVTVRWGNDITETVTAEEFITASKYSCYGSPLERRDLLSKQKGGLTVSQTIHQMASEAYEKTPQVIRVKERSHEGFLQGDDRVVVRIGTKGEPKEIPVQKFVFSEEFSGLGTPKERVRILAELDGGRAVAWPLSVGSKYLD